MKNGKITKLDKPFEIKPYSHAELCVLYGVSKHVLRKWVKAIEAKLGNRNGWFYNNQQVKTIIENYGIPGQIVNENE